MEADILHSGFDGLKFTLTTDIPSKLRAELASAKEHAKETRSDCQLQFGDIILNVSEKGGRGFTANTGNFGAVWLFQDPEERISNNPGITVDFRAFGLATGGLEGAERHFRDCMNAFDIPYVETQLRITRADFAVDFLAPWFEPDREALVVPPRTTVTELAVSEHAIGVGTETISSGARVTGFRAGHISSRQLAVYDKRAEVLSKSDKAGWIDIWNGALAAIGRPPLDVAYREASQVWRFEMRLGSKQLRNKFEMRNWQDVHDIIGDAFTDALSRMRYCSPTTDTNRARWPLHSLWRQFEDVVGVDLKQNCSGVLPSDVIKANRSAKMRELDAQLLGLFITRAAISEVTAKEFSEFMENHIEALSRQAQEHPIPLAERLTKARTKYQLR